MFAKWWFLYFLSFFYIYLLAFFYKEELSLPIPMYLLINAESPNLISSDCLSYITNIIAFDAAIFPD